MRYAILDKTHARFVESHGTIQDASVAFWTLSAHELKRAREIAVEKGQKVAMHSYRIVASNGEHVMPDYAGIMHRLPSWVRELYEQKS